MLNLRLELDMVAEWMKANRLTLNVNKTKYVIFGNRHTLSQNTDYNLSIQGTK